MANNLTVLDSTGTTKTVKTTDNASVHTPHHSIEDPCAGTQTNDVKVTLDSEAVVLGAGSAAVGKLAANSGVDIGDVDVLSIAAGENHLGSVGGTSTVVETSITRPADTTAYADGDAVTDSTSTPNDSEFSGCSRVNDGSGVILSATLIDSVNGTVPTGFDLFLFDTAPTATNDNTAFALTDANANDCIGVISFTSASDGIDAGANNYIYHKSGLNIPFVCSGGATKLYGLLVVRGAYTPASAEVFQMRLGILQD